MPNKKNDQTGSLKLKITTIQGTSDLRKHLEENRKIVQTWPAWEQNILGSPIRIQSAQSANTKQR